MGWTRRNVGVTVLLAMDEHRKQVGLRVAQLRDAKGWTQDELAVAAKTTTKTISRMENGRHEQRRSTLRNVADALGVAEETLVGPPPDPLGLNGPTQLDRIESMLTEVLDLLRQTDEPAKTPSQIAAEAAQRLEQQRKQAAKAQRTPQKKRRAS